MNFDLMNDRNLVNISEISRIVGLPVNTFLKTRVCELAVEALADQLQVPTAWLFQFDSDGDVWVHHRIASHYIKLTRANI